MQTLDTLLLFLSDYKDALNIGVILGLVAALFAAAISAIIYIVRWRNLIKIRELNHKEEIKAGELKGLAEGLNQRRSEIIANTK